MQIVTVANRAPTAPYFCYDAMLASCRRFGHEPIVLGWGEPWGGLGNKPRQLMRAIEQRRITDPHILFIDAYDTILARPPCDIMAAYGAYGSRIVWSAERNLFPEIPCDRDRDFPAKDGGFRYLNSGVCVADTDAMYQYLHHIMADKIPDDYRKDDGSMCHVNDQEIALLAFTEEPLRHLMALDTNCTIALNMHSVAPNELDVTGDRIRLLVTGTEPCVFHANGNSKDSGMLKLVLAKLGY